MKTFAYCAASLEQSTRRAAGVQPLLSPPYSAFGDTGIPFKAANLEGYDLLYFKLHGLPDQPYWYGDDWITALAVEHIHEADLAGAVVFVANCHLWNKEPDDSVMLQALRDAGAAHVIGGPGKNFAKRNKVYAVDQLGRGIRRLMRVGFSAPRAFQIARIPLHLTHAQKHKAIKDALGFRLFSRPDAV